MPNAMDIMMLAQRKKGLKKFKELLDNHKTLEKDFQEFFDDNQWVFNLTLDSRCLIAVNGKFESRIVGGTFEKSGRIPDGHLKSQSNYLYNNIVLVEIKGPNAKLLEDKPYNNTTDIFAQSNISRNAVAQILRTARDYASEEKGESIDDENDLSLTVSKLILVIGNQKEFEGDKNKKISFDLYRDNHKNVTILTYDELYKRAEHIVESCEAKVENQETIYEK